MGDLFSGIGGFSLAAHWMGWRTAWFSEVDPYACRVLAHHWPDVPNLGDIRAVDWTTVPPVDVLTGGFPCQPHSLAGQRKGSTDERDLFDEIIRCARVLRPRFLVLENVPGLFTSDAGRFFGRVLGALAACGYDAEWRVVAAADVGAPHKRDRVWIVAYADRGCVRGDCADSQDGRAVFESRAARVVRGGGRWTTARARRMARRAWPTQPSVCRVADGLPHRVDRLRALGNSIVPQVALEIFRRVEMIAQQNGLPMQEAA